MLRPLALCCLVLPAAARADEVTLDGGKDRLSGAVRSIDESGVIALESPLAAEPLRLKSSAVEKIRFSTTAAAAQNPTALVELTNGDLLPADIEAMDEEKLTVVSPQAGRLEIPRAALKSMQLGVSSEQMIYQGPRSLEEWTTPGGEIKNWTFNQNALVANGQAQAAMRLELPQQFTLRFTLVWQPRQQPNFQVFFADPLMEKGVASDRYYLQFGGAGLEVKREAAEGKRYHTILLLNRTPDQFPANRLGVELRVDRKSSRLQLFLNGEPEGAFADPIAAPPAGSGIAFTSNAAAGISQEIREIEVRELDADRHKHRTEERGDPEHDSLISRDDDRWTGRLLDIRETPAGRVLRFQGKFQQEPLEIAASEVSTVFFAAAKPAEQAAAKPGFILRLHGGGALRLASSRFEDGIVSASHPLLGELKLRREGLASIERGPAEGPPAAEQEPRANVPRVTPAEPPPVVE
jgi:hypothetical protein